MGNFQDDYSFGVCGEDVFEEYFKSIGYNINKNGKTDIHDWTIEHKGKKVNVELKTRRCSSTMYNDTIIGANKLGEAWNKYYSNGEETIFFFLYTDGLFFINPFNYTPRRDFLLQRWDRGIDKPKGWVYFKTSDLTKI